MKDKAENIIRTLALAGHSESIRKLLLTPHQRKVMATVEKHGSITAAGLSARLDITREDAANRLRRLRKKGYLIREGDVTEYEYRSAQ